jgi:hypothetical protein
LTARAAVRSFAPAMLDYFVREAGEYLERLGAIAHSPAGPGAEGTEFVRLTRALRGSALMAKQGALAHAAQGLETLARAVVEGRRAWDEAVRRTVIRAVEECRGLVGRSERPAPRDEDRAFRLGAELERLAAPTGAEVPALLAVRPSRAGAPAAAAVSVESLFHDDAGPHLLGDLAESFTSYAQLVARYGAPQPRCGCIPFMAQPTWGSRFAPTPGYRPIRRWRIRDCLRCAMRYRRICAIQDNHHFLARGPHPCDCHAVSPSPPNAISALSAASARTIPPHDEQKTVSRRDRRVR